MQSGQEQSATAVPSYAVRAYYIQTVTIGGGAVVAVSIYAGSIRVVAVPIHAGSIQINGAI